MLNLVELREAGDLMASTIKNFECAWCRTKAVTKKGMRDHFMSKHAVEAITQPSHERNVAVERVRAAGQR